MQQVVTALTFTGCADNNPAWTYYNASQPCWAFHTAHARGAGDSLLFCCFDNLLCYFQAALLDSFFGTERGLSGRSEVRAEINELITQLEAKNPTPSPTEVRQVVLATPPSTWVQLPCVLL